MIYLVVAPFERSSQMAKYTHLSINERKTIQESLNNGTSFRQISMQLSRDRNTICREVRRNASSRRTGGYGTPFNNCLNRRECDVYRLCTKEDCKRQTCTGCPFCFKLCPHFQPEYCARLEKPPYVCNGCHKRTSCSLEKFIYDANAAQKTADSMAVISREGIAVSVCEIERLDALISPLIKQGQSIHNIFMTHKDEIMCDETTIYKYIKMGLFAAKPLDLTNTVKMKPRRKKPKLRVEKGHQKGRSYRDFLAFIKENPDVPIVQMDTVEGKKDPGEPVLLTIHFVEAELMLAFRRQANTARSVKDIFDWLYETLGRETFKELFPVILTDNGSEFSGPSSLEKDSEGLFRTKIFYTDPGAPYQKGACENNHTLIRRVIPKGVSLKPYSQDQITLMMCYIDSYKRKKLKNRCPIDVFNFFHDPLILKKLGIKLIDPDDVILDPSLFD